MESDWNQFLDALNKKIEGKLEPLYRELNNQDELIKKLSTDLKNLSQAIQRRCGKVDINNHKANNHEEKLKLSEGNQEEDHKIIKDEKEEPKEIAVADS